MDLRLSFDLHFVGPRPAAATAGAAVNAWCALTLATALSAEPADTAEARVEALLPWNVISWDVTGPAAPPPFKLCLWDEYAATLTIVGNLAPDKLAITPFDTQLRDQITAKAKALAKAALPAIAYKWAQKEDEPPVGETDDTLSARLPWLALSHGLADLPAQISQPLGARWFVEVPLAGITSEAAKFAIVPATVTDNGKAYTLDPAHAVQIFGQWELKYGLVGHPDILAYAKPLQLTEWTGESWLDVTSSAADSLVDIGATLYRALDPAALAGALDATALTGVLTITPVRAVPAALAAAVRKRAIELGAVEAASNTGPTQATVIDVRRRALVDLVLVAVRPPPSGSGPPPPVPPLSERLMTALSARVAAWWTGNLTAFAAAAQALDGKSDDYLLPGDTLSFDAAKLATALAGYASRVLAGPAGAHLPGKGIDFLIGDAADRLVHEKTGAPDRHAQYGVMVRRSAAGVAVDAAPWRLVTAAVPVLDTGEIAREQPWGSPDILALPSPEKIVVRGIALAFIDKVLRNDDCYYGEPMLGERAASFTNRETLAPDLAGLPSLPALTSLAYGPAAKFTAVDAEAVTATLCPPLRDGDVYQVAAFVIDRAGGLPAELTNGKPWQVHPAALATLAAPRHSSAITFLRGVPPGELNIQPGIQGLDGGKKASWPALPAGVSLRAAEWHRTVASPGERAQVLLLAPAAIKLNPQPKPGYRFTVEPPRVAENVLLKWCLPQKDDAHPVWSRDAIGTEFARIKTALEAQMSDRNETPEAAIIRAQSLLPHDPAIAGIALHYRIFDNAGAETTGDQHKLLPALPFVKPALTVSCAADADPAADFHVHVAPGSFAVLEFSLLIDKAAFDARFDAQLVKGSTDKLVDGEDYKSFKSGTVLVEMVSDALPDAAVLYDALSIAPGLDGSAIVRCDAAKPENFVFVDRFELERQRWTWRNLPLGDPQEDWLPAAGAARERLLSSGLPDALGKANQSARDTDSDVLEFDARAVIDRGFVTRSLASGSWPRSQDGSALPGAGLLTDDRDGYAAADYLRYRLTAVSRYAALLPGGGRQLAKKTGGAALEPEPQWRRVALRWRSASQTPRALNLRAVLPLTATPALNAITGLSATPDAKKATPFLALFDEIWFREYGQGETLRAELTLESREIGDTTEDSRPLKGGPLPDKHMTRSAGRWEKTWTEDAAPGDTANWLDCFGPFGFSFDRSGNQALANVTAFLLYLPEEVAPEWSVTVRFRRVLHGLASDGSAIPSFESKPTDGYPLYTIACSRTLWQATERESPALIGVKIDINGKLTGAYTLQNVGLGLEPYAGADPKITAQFRYLLQLGPVVSDGGEGVDVFLPFQAIWLDTNTALGGEDLPASGRLQGQILEVEFNGNGADQMSSVKSLVVFFDKLLPKGNTGVADAVASVRRISEPIEIIRS